MKLYLRITKNRPNMFDGNIAIAEITQIDLDELGEYSIRTCMMTSPRSGELSTRSLGSAWTKGTTERLTRN